MPVIAATPTNSYETRICPHVVGVDDQFWHIFRLVLEASLLRRKQERLEIRNGIDPQRFLTFIKSRADDTSRSDLNWLVGRLGTDPDLLERVVAYFIWRRDEGARRLNLMRTEQEAYSALKDIDPSAVVKSTVLVQHGGLEPERINGVGPTKTVFEASIEILTKRQIAALGLDEGASALGQRIVQTHGDQLWVSPRRLDLCWPSPVNPVFMGETKEYWGAGGGSKMSDAIYECQLVGEELSGAPGPKINHYVFLDGRDQWEARNSDLLRAIDLLQCGLVDDLFCGQEAIDRWPMVLAGAVTA